MNLIQLFIRFITSATSCGCLLLTLIGTAPLRADDEFGQLDTDNDGLISYSEMKNTATKLNLPMSISSFDEADLNSDGSLDPFEYSQSPWSGLVN